MTNPIRRHAIHDRATKAAIRNKDITCDTMDGYEYGFVAGYRAAQRDARLKASKGQEYEIISGFCINPQALLSNKDEK